MLVVVLNCCKQSNTAAVVETEEICGASSVLSSWEQTKPRTWDAKLTTGRPTLLFSGGPCLDRDQIQPNLIRTSHT